MGSTQSSLPSYRLLEAPSPSGLRRISLAGSGLPLSLLETRFHDYLLASLQSDRYCKLMLMEKSLHAIRLLHVRLQDLAPPSNGKRPTVLKLIYQQPGGKCLSQLRLCAQRLLSLALNLSSALVHIFQQTGESVRFNEHVIFVNQGNAKLLPILSNGSMGLSLFELGNTVLYASAQNKEFNITAKINALAKTMPELAAFVRNCMGINSSQWSLQHLRAWLQKQAYKTVNSQKIQTSTVPAGRQGTHLYSIRTQSVGKQNLQIGVPPIRKFRFSERHQITVFSDRPSAFSEELRPKQDRTEQASPTFKDDSLKDSSDFGFGPQTEQGLQKTIAFSRLDFANQHHEQLRPDPSDFQSHPFFPEDRPASYGADSAQPECEASPREDLPSLTMLDSQMSRPSVSSQLGEFLSSTRANFVVQRLEDGSAYEGWKLNGRRHGFGKYMFQDGSIYEGQWQEGSMWGKGVLYNQEARPLYRGCWRAGKFQGLGVLYNDEPTALKGEFDCGDFGQLGSGWQRFEGTFRQDRKEGRAMLFLTNGERFQGYFSEDAVNGHGVFHGLSGPVSGYWIDNVLESRH